MSIVRIGDILVNAKAVHSEMRDRILVQRGKAKIRFGTAALEVGALSEHLMLRALSAQRQAPPAGVDDLADIRPDILRLVPAKLAARLFVIPFRRVGRNIALAMRDPSDLPAVDEISFLTGLPMTPHVALEVRVMQALERYYRVEVDQRFLELAAKLDRARSQSGASPAGPPRSPSATLPAPQRAPSATAPAPAQRSRAATAPVSQVPPVTAGPPPHLVDTSQPRALGSVYAKLRDRRPASGAFRAADLTDPWAGMDRPDVSTETAFVEDVYEPRVKTPTPPPARRPSTPITRAASAHLPQQAPQPMREIDDDDLQHLRKRPNADVSTAEVPAPVIEPGPVSPEAYAPPVPSGPITAPIPVPPTEKEPITSPVEPPAAALAPPPEPAPSPEPVALAPEPPPPSEDVAASAAPEDAALTSAAPEDAALTAAAEPPPPLEEPAPAEPSAEPAEPSAEPAAEPSAESLAAVERAVDEAARLASEAAERAAAAEDDAPMPPEADASKDSSAEPEPVADAEVEKPPAEEILPEPLDLIARLSRAESRDDVAEAVLDAALEYVDRAVLVISQKDRVLGWSAKPAAENFRTFVLPYSDASIFSTLKDSDSFYVGPPADLPGNRKLFRALGTKKKPTISVVPVTLKGKSVLFLFCETDADKPVPQIPPLRRLAAMTAVGLEIVLLKNRLRNL